MVGIYRKYDDVIRQEPGTLSVITGRLRWGRYVENRKIALELLLPRWQGFVLATAEENVNEVTAQEAIQEVDTVVESIKGLRVWEDGVVGPSAWVVNGFDDNRVSEVICTLVSLYFQRLSICMCRSFKST